jgi:hypothetical protein
MKKILFLIAFIFAVVCYAAPPPDVSPVNLAPDVGCQFTTDVNVTVAPIGVEAQEVAYVYRGNTVCMNEAPLFAEQINRFELPPVPVFTINYSTCSFECDLPPLIRTWHVANYNYNRDMQFSNYGYPISMN